MADAYYENKPKGEYGVLYFRVAGKRKRVSLGYAKTKSAKAAHEKQRQFVAELETHKAANQKLTLELQQTLEMYTEKNPKFVNDLEAKGLLELLDEKPKMTLGELRDEWFEMIRLTTKPRTARTYRQAITPFVNFMPDDCLISDVTTGDVVDFEAETIANGTASTTLGNYLKRTKAAFAYAVKKEWLDRNPIEYETRKYKMKKTAETERLQKEMVTSDALETLLNTHMHFEWKVLLHIVRYTGCRISEALILRWEDVDFDDDDPTITFRGKDTQHSIDRADMPVRKTPMWEQIRPILKHAYTIKNKNDKFVLNNILKLDEKPEFEVTDKNGEVIQRGRYGTNAYRGLLKIMKRAGLQCWPKLFHSMRDFRINEVANMEGITVGAMDAWFGNSEAVRRKHYASTEDHSVTRKRLAGGQISDASGQTVGSEEAGTSSQEHLTNGTNLENIVEKLLQAGEGSQEPLVEYIRRVVCVSAKQGD